MYILSSYYLFEIKLFFDLFDFQSWPFNFHLNWESQQVPLKSAIIDANSSKNGWSSCVQDPIKKAYYEEECISKTYHDFDTEKKLHSHRNTRNRRRNDYQYSEPTRHAAMNCNNEESCYYKSCAYYG